jgi:hypothetical protein
MLPNSREQGTLLTTPAGCGPSSTEQLNTLRESSTTRGSKAPKNELRAIDE